MQQGSDAGRRGGTTEGTGVRFTLQQYRDDRVRENVRRTLIERTAAGPAYVGPSSTADGENPRRRAVLRETTMRSAFEYVKYNMPETVPQEVVARRQIARDMADPGIYSDGPRESDIIHLPPRHATLAPPATRTRRTLLGQHQVGLDGSADAEPLPRPYVPRGIIEAHGEPNQYGGDKQVGRYAMSRRIAREASGLRQASRDLQEALGTNVRRRSSEAMGLIEVDAATYEIQQARDQGNVDGVLRALRRLHKDWVPDQKVLKETKVGEWVNELKTNANAKIAELATIIDKDWRDYIRVEIGKQALLTAEQRGTEDPFMDEDANPHLYGQTISRETLDAAIVQKRQAALDYNRAASQAIRQRVQAEKRGVTLQLADLVEQNLRDIQLRAAAQAAVEPLSPSGASDHGEATSGTFLGHGKALETVLGAKRGISDSDDTITDPDFDDDEGDEDGNDGAGGVMPTGNQDFQILEVDASPERPQDEGSPGDRPVQSIEVDEHYGLCHECPDFPGTYHHVCAPENPACAGLLATPRHGCVNPHEPSPSYGPSGTSRGTPRTSPPLSQDGQAAMNELARTATDYSLDEFGYPLPNFPGDNINLGRTSLHSGERALPPPRPSRHPAIVSNSMPDPFASPAGPSGPFAIKSRDVQLNGPSSKTPTAGLRLRSRYSPPSLSPSEPTPRITKAEYMSWTEEQLLAELIFRGTPPHRGTTKEVMVIMIMGGDAIHESIERDRRNGMTINAEGEAENPIVLSSSSSGSASSSRSSRASARVGSKRGSPAQESAGSAAKRLRTKSGVSPKTIAV